MVVSFALALACSQPTPDVGGTVPVRVEDDRVVVLVREVDRVSDADPREAARMLRATVIPRAHANALAAGAVRPSHPRAERLASRLASLMDERVATLEDYAASLERDDLPARIAALRRQRRLEVDLARLEAALAAASREPPSRGCARSEP